MKYYENNKGIATLLVVLITSCIVILPTIYYLYNHTEVFSNLEKNSQRSNVDNSTVEVDDNKTKKRTNSSLENDYENPFFRVDELSNELEKYTENYGLIYEKYCANKNVLEYLPKNYSAVVKYANLDLEDLETGLLNDEYSETELHLALDNYAHKLLLNNRFEESLVMYHCSAETHQSLMSAYRLVMIYHSGSSQFEEIGLEIDVQKPIDVDNEKALFWIFFIEHFEEIEFTGYFTPMSSSGWNYIAVRDEIINAPLLNDAQFDNVEKWLNDYFDKIDNSLKDLNDYKQNKDKASELGAKLFLAVTENDFESVRKLHEQGADINYVSPLIAVTPLNMAVEKRNNEIAKYLIDNGAYYDNSAMFDVIASENNLEILKYLNLSQAELTSVDSNGWTVLNHALFYENTEVLEWLLDTGYFTELVNKQLYGSTLAHSVVGSRSVNMEILKLLVGAGADLTIKNVHGMTVLDTAIRFSDFYSGDSNHGEVIEYIESVLKSR